MMRIKSVMRVSRAERMIRLFRATWDRGVVGDGTGYSAKLTFALYPTLARFRRERSGWDATLFGVRVHYMRSYGGRFT